MNIKKYKLLIVPLIILIMVSISLSLMLIFQFKTIAEISQMPLWRLLGFLIEISLAVLFFNYSIRYLNRKFPWNKNWSLRAFFDLIMALIMPLLIISFISYSEQVGWISQLDNNDKAKIFLYILPLITSTLLVVIVEMIVSLEEQNNLAIKLAYIETEQLNTKYSALKEQLDHHFLFNNLSVLSSLIYEDVEKADRFIQDFSSTYRYVLQINQRNLVSVKEELNFIDNYLNLYKFRFEQGFDFNVSVNEETKKLLIPPLTLQVLVENAIKHNIVSCKQPLILQIKNDDNKLQVKNNFQEKKDKETSTKTGQNNLIEKYKLLACDTPTFKIENNEYICIIPLIEA